MAHKVEHAVLPCVDHCAHRSGKYTVLQESDPRLCTFPCAASSGAAASEPPYSAARTASRSQRRESLGGSVVGTPASLLLNPHSQQAPGTGLRTSSGQPTPMTRPELGYVGGFWHPHASAQRRSSMAPSVSPGDLLNNKSPLLYHFLGA